MHQTCIVPLFDVINLSLSLSIVPLNKHVKVLVFSLKNKSLSLPKNKTEILKIGRKEKFCPNPNIYLPVWCPTPSFPSVLKII